MDNLKLQLAFERTNLLNDYMVAEILNSLPKDTEQIQTSLYENIYDELIWGKEEFKHEVTQKLLRLSKCNLITFQHSSQKWFLHDQVLRRLFETINQWAESENQREELLTLELIKS